MKIQNLAGLEERYLHAAKKEFCSFAAAINAVMEASNSMAQSDISDFCHHGMTKNLKKDMTKYYREDDRFTFGVPSVSLGEVTFKGKAQLPSINEDGRYLNAFQYQTSTGTNTYSIIEYFNIDTREIFYEGVYAVRSYNCIEDSSAMLSFYTNGWDVWTAEKRGYKPRTGELVFFEEFPFSLKDSKKLKEVKRKNDYDALSVKKIDIAELEIDDNASIVYDEWDTDALVYPKILIQNVCHLAGIGQIDIELAVPVKGLLVKKRIGTKISNTKGASVRGILVYQKNYQRKEVPIEVPKKLAEKAIKFVNTAELKKPWFIDQMVSKSEYVRAYRTF